MANEHIEAVQITDQAKIAEAARQVGHSPAHVATFEKEGGVEYMELREIEHPPTPSLGNRLRRLFGQRP